ncbi:hypothetical protein Slin15195_G062550 [Septoria linicola]|uniref:Uncharacterized protein n=1 Tax=Septoria linicola TaxID=215465 RepID=A0A9Q9EIM2_9PEZI|nr:hypothetical protein Slin14017_G112880 [Septoria linicola]USW52936.1 hypothetical protein Slin15195_G062550 [Septoria linicola]
MTTLRSTTPRATGSPLQGDAGVRDVPAHLRDLRSSCAFELLKTTPEEPAGPPLSNFPLPRELRDGIYQYLLAGDYVRAERKPMRPAPDFRAFSFHTNILAMNKEIHREASELLAKRNIFVGITTPGAMSMHLLSFSMCQSSRTSRTPVELSRQAPLSFTSST